MKILRQRLTSPHMHTHWMLSRAGQLPSAHSHLTVMGAVFKDWYTALMGLELTTVLSLTCAGTTDLYHLSHWPTLQKSPFGGVGIKEMAQGLRELVAFAEHHCSTPALMSSDKKRTVMLAPGNLKPPPTCAHTRSHTTEKSNCYENNPFYFSKLSTVTQAYSPSYLIVWDHNVRSIHATQTHLK